MSLEELRAASRGWLNKDWSKQRKSPLKERSRNVARKEQSPKLKGDADRELEVEVQEKLVIDDQLGQGDIALMNSEQKAGKAKKLKLREVKAETQTGETSPYSYLSIQSTSR